MPRITNLIFVEMDLYLYRRNIYLQLQEYKFESIFGIYTIGGVDCMVVIINYSATWSVDAI